MARTPLRPFALLLVTSVACTTVRPLTDGELIDIAAARDDDRTVHNGEDTPQVPPDTKLTVRTLQTTYERPLSSLRLIDGKLMLQHELGQGRAGDVQLLPDQRAASVTVPNRGGTAALICIAISVASTVGLMALFVSSLHVDLGGPGG